MTPQQKITELEAKLLRQKQLTEFYEQGNIYVSGRNFDNNEKIYDYNRGDQPSYGGIVDVQWPLN